MEKVFQDYCPYLGLVGDKDLHCLFPDVSHRCYRDGARRQIAAAQQEQVCLTPAHLACDYVGNSGERRARLFGLGIAILLAATVSYWALPDLKLPSASVPTSAGARPSGTAAAGLAGNDAKSVSNPASSGTPSESPVSLILTSGPPVAAVTVSPVPLPTVTPSRSITNAVSTPAPASPRVHVVARGETLGTVATRYGTSVDALLQANSLTNRNFVAVGQRLIIP